MESIQPSDPTGDTFSSKPPQCYNHTSWSHAQMFIDPEGIELTYIANERMTQKISDSDLPESGHGQI